MNNPCQYLKKICCRYIVLSAINDQTISYSHVRKYYINNNKYEMQTSYGHKLPLNASFTLKCL